MGRELLAQVAVFAAGFIDEAVAVAWVHNSERGRALATGLCSALQALSIVVGVGASARDWHYAPTFVAGYALGATSAVWFKQRSTHEEERKP